MHSIIYHSKSQVCITCINFLGWNFSIFGGYRLFNSASMFHYSCINFSRWNLLSLFSYFWKFISHVNIYQDQEAFMCYWHHKKQCHAENENGMTWLMCHSANCEGKLNYDQEGNFQRNVSYLPCESLSQFHCWESLHIQCASLFLYEQISNRPIQGIF